MSLGVADLVPLNFIFGEGIVHNACIWIVMISLCRKIEIFLFLLQATKAQLSKVFSAMLAIHSNKPGMVNSYQFFLYILLKRKPFGIYFA